MKPEHASLTLSVRTDGWWRKAILAVCVLAALVIMTWDYVRA